MANYIAMLKWTQQGIKNVSESPTRLDAVRAALKKDGVNLKEMYMVTGRHDMIIVLDAPNDVALAKAMLTAASQGNVTTETCRAFTEDEYRAIIKGLAG